MTHGATHDAAEHIAPALVRRRDAIRDQEAGRAQVIRNHAEGRELIARRLHAIELFFRRDQVREQVDLIIRVHALQDGRNPLEPHAGVDRRLGQGDALTSVIELLVLHEDEVPDLDEPVAILVGRSRRAAPDLVAVIVEDFRARAARAGVTHHPEIVVGRDADNLRLRQARNLFPVAGRLVIVVIDGDHQLFLRQAVVARQQGPGMLDRLLLEIVPEREVAEHLEEGVVARGVADIVEVVVLAARADAFLRGRCAWCERLLRAGEDVLELHHAGVNEQQRVVAVRHQRGRRLHDVIGPGKIVEKSGANGVHARMRSGGVGRAVGRHQAVP